MNIFLIILTIGLSYFYGVVYNNFYYEITIEKWYDMDRLILGLFKLMFLLIAWYSLLVTYSQSTNSILGYFLLTFPLLLEMVEDFILLKNNKEKPMTEKVFLVTMIGIILIAFGFALNFVTLPNINTFILANYNFISIFAGLLWVIGKVIWFICDIYNVNHILK